MSMHDSTGKKDPLKEQIKRVQKKVDGSYKWTQTSYFSWCLVRSCNTRYWSAAPNGTRAQIAFSGRTIQKATT